MASHSIELMEQYEATIKDQEIEQLSLSNRIKALELSKTNSRMAFLAALVLVCLVGLGAALWLYSKLRRANGQLSGLIKTRDRFFSIIAHDLKSPLVNLQTFFTIFSQQAISMTQRQLSTYTDEMLLELNKLNQLTHNLLTWSLNQQEGIQVNKQQVLISDIIEKNITLYGSLIKMKDIDVQNQVPARCTLYTDPNMADFVFRNLLNNAVKFTPNGGQIRFTAVISGQQTNIFISDTGNGIKADIWNALLKGGTDNTNDIARADKQIETGTGLGLKLCMDFLRKLNSHMELCATSARGTTLMVQFE